MRPGYVYFIRVENGERPIKIGHTRHPKSRLRLLQQWSPWPLTLLAVFKCAEPEKEERAIHRRLSAVRMRGEWFVGAAVGRERAALSRRLKQVDGTAEDLREGCTREIMVRLRTTPADARRYRETARKQHQSMSEWIRGKLNARRDAELAASRDKKSKRARSRSAAA